MKPIMRLWALVAGLLPAVTFAGHGLDDLTKYSDSSSKGLAVAQAADWHFRGFGDSEVSLEMVLMHPDGEKFSRNLRIRTLEGAERGDRNLVIFDYPADQKGVALLTISHRNDDDDQYLYLPTVRRVKKIASNTKSGSFVGSEFSYEDFTRQQVDEFSYAYKGQESVNGASCHVIERFPTDPNSGYSKGTLWIEEEELRVVKMDFYDRKEALIKSLQFNDYRMFDGYWRPMEALMVNKVNGKSTLLKFGEYKFKNQFSASQFESSKLSFVR